MANINVNVFTATDKTQGRRDNDFCFTNNGELVRVGIDCDTEPDGPCGCFRAMTGIKTGWGTTTFIVAQMPQDEFTEAFLESFEGDSDELDGDEIDEAYREYIMAAESFDVGTVLERRGLKIQKRETV